jgi:hypothetical protein
MPLAYAKHEPLSLRQHPEYGESWLHERIKEDPSILGLGELDLLKHEHAQQSGGRLDLLLADTENDIWYETEIMLGPTDPSHIIRCIEYWDVERKRYPAYDHVAVLVAEDITARFLNVISLLSGSVPLIAIQLNALKVGAQIVLDFVKVLDQRQLREVITPSDTASVDRAWWENRTDVASIQICEEVAKMANEIARPPLKFYYTKSHIGLGVDGRISHDFVFWPKKKYTNVRIVVNELDVWSQRCQSAGLDVTVVRAREIRLRLNAQELGQHQPLLRELVHQVVKEHQDS